MLMYNFIEYGDNYSKTCESFWHYYRDAPFLDAYGDIADFPADSNNSASFKFKTKIPNRIGNDSTKMLTLGYHRNI